jgi:hypothetical protein
VDFEGTIVDFKYPYILERLNSKLSYRVWDFKNTKQPIKFDEISVADEENATDLITSFSMVQFVNHRRWVIIFRIMDRAIFVKDFAKARVIFRFELDGEESVDASLCCFYWHEASESLVFAYENFENQQLCIQGWYFTEETMEFSKFGKKRIRISQRPGPLQSLQIASVSERAIVIISHQGDSSGPTQHMTADLVDLSNRRLRLVARLWEHPDEPLAASLITSHPTYPLYYHVPLNDASVPSKVQILNLLTGAPKFNLETSSLSEVNSVWDYGARLSQVGSSNVLMRSLGYKKDIALLQVRNSTFQPNRIFARPLRLPDLPPNETHAMLIYEWPGCVLMKVTHSFDQIVRGRR